MLRLGLNWSFPVTIALYMSCPKGPCTMHSTTFLRPKTLAGRLGVTCALREWIDSE